MVHVARDLRHVGLHRRIDTADDHREKRVAAQPRELPGRLASAVEANAITEAQAQRFVAALAERGRAGTFFTNTIGYSVAGIKA